MPLDEVLMSLGLELMVTVKLAPAVVAVGLGGVSGLVGPSVTEAV